jgi:hypothetical protein
MNPTYLPALAALSGSAVGGLTSFLSSWLGQSTQLRAQVFLNDKSRRQELYREFVDEASKGYIDSITTNTPDRQPSRGTDRQDRAVPRKDALPHQERVGASRPIPSTVFCAQGHPWRTAGQCGEPP